MIIEIMVKIDIDNSNNDSEIAINNLDVNFHLVSFDNSSNISGVNSFDHIESNSIDDCNYNNFANINNFIIFLTRLVIPITFLLIN